MKGVAAATAVLAFATLQVGGPETSSGPHQAVRQERVSLQGAQENLNGVCQELTKAASRLQGVNRIAQDFVESGRRMIDASSKAEKEIAETVATPGPMKPAPTTGSPQTATGTIAGPRSGETSIETAAGIRELRRFDGEAKRQKDILVAELKGIRSDLRIIRGSFGRISPGSAVPDRDKQCLSKAAQELQREAAVLQDLGSLLKARQDEYNSRLQELRPASAGLCAECDLARCGDCCAKKNPVTAVEGSPARAAQEQALSRCLRWCEFHAEICRDLKRGKDREDELFGAALEVVKDVAETQTSVTAAIH